MKSLRVVTLLAGLMLAFAISAAAQLTGTKNIPGDYADLAAAVTDLNTQGVGAGGVTINLIAGNPQTAPAGGYIIGGAGSMVLTTASMANPIVFTGNANTITAPATHTIGALNDAIFKLIGADWTTISGFSMTENALNVVTAAATNTMTEWGVALLYVTATDGAQNNTISGNTIDLDRTYQNTFGIYANATHTATAVTTSATATGAAGGNSGLTITADNITDVNQGIVVVGPTAAADQNDPLTIGGSAPNANILTNFGTTGTFSSYANVSGTVNGILVRNTKNANVSFNTITSSVGGVTAGTLNGIQFPAFSATPTGTFTQNVNNNTISLQSGLAGGAMNGINCPSGSASTTSIFNANNNNFATWGHTVAGTAAITFITNASTHFTQSISSNTFTNLTVNTTGSVTFISNTNTAPAGATKNVNSNSIVTAFNKTGAGGTVTIFTDNGSDPGASNTNNFNNNNFSNITLTGATTFAGVQSTNGPSVTAGPTKNVNNNTIGSITGGTSAVTAITTSFNGGPTTVSGNTIHSIMSASSITAITNGTGVGTRTVSKNKVYDLNGTVAGSVILGIADTTTTASSAVTISNNLIGNLTAGIATSSNGIRGIDITGSATTATFGVFFNTVYINNTTSGAGFGSSGISVLASSTATTSTLNLKNNIIVNTSVQNGAGLTVAYRRSAGTAGTLANYASTSNNNDFFAGTPSATNLIYSDGTSSAQTITVYKNGVFTAGTIAPRDSASISENPPFLSTTGSSPQFLHINPAVPTQLESGGMPVAGITDDFDGDVRNVSTPDIGADEGMFTLLDLVAPSITYTPLTNTSSTANRVLTATITDPSGVAGGSLVPRTYFRKNGGPYVWTACTGSSPTYSCTIDHSNVGGVAATDLIEYFVVAQDTAGNVGANPSAGFSATSVEIITSPPTNPNQYTIVTAISGSFTVGTAETYTSLTNPGGIFEYINNNEVAGAIIISITSDLAGETGTHGLNAFAGAHTILIRPSGGPRSVTGSAASTALIRLNGASRVTIDGSFTGGTDRSLTIENTSVTTPQVVRFQSIGTTPVVNNTLMNTIVRNGVNTSSAVVLTDTAGNAGYFNNITIQNNDVQRAFVGIFTNSVVLAGNGSGLLITQNKVDSVGANAIRNVGLYVQGADGATVSNNTVGNFSIVEGENDTGIWLATGAVNTTVSNNTVSNLGQTTTGAFAPYGIRDSGGTAASGNTIVGNTITNMTSNGTTAVYGIENSSGGTSILRNNVSGIINTNTNTYGAYGINIAAGNNSVVRNNFVSNVNHDMTGGVAFSTSFGVFGIRVAAGTGHQIYNNSVNLYGLQPGVPNSSLLTAAFAVVSTASTGMDVRNNIFANNITGGTTSIAHVSVYLPSGGTSAMNLTDNKNAYFFGTDAARQGAGQAGTTAGTNFFTTLPTLAAYTSTLHAAMTNDNMSQAYTTPTVPSPFISNTDLHFGDIASPLIGAGDVIGSVTNDFDMDPRPASNPDIGADELVQATASSFPGGIFYNAVLAGSDLLIGDATVTNSLTLTGISNTGGNTLTLGCNASVSGVGATIETNTNYVIGNVKKEFCGSVASFVFPVGTVPVVPEISGYSPLTVDNVALEMPIINPSSLTVSVTDTTLGGLDPMNSTSRFWTLTEGGNLIADLTFVYRTEDINGPQGLYKLYRRVGTINTEVPGHVITPGPNTGFVAGITDFSQWGIGQLAPTAANATVGGRVLTSTGRGVYGARVVMLDPNGTPRMALTNMFGYYRFYNVPVGDTYVFSAFDKRYQFVQPSIVTAVNGDDDGLNFVALSGQEDEGASRTYFDNAPMDFDGDGFTDASVFRESNNSWFIRRSSDNTYYSQPFGLNTDRLAPADFDGDGRTDIAVFRESEGNWYIWLSRTNSLRVERFASSGDIPVPSDFDGDGRADMAVWRAAKGVFVVLQSSNGKTVELTFENPGENAVARVADYDGDGKADAAVFDAITGNWQIIVSRSGKTVELEAFGTGDIPVFADFDGDGQADPGVLVSDAGTWTVQLSRTGEIIRIQQGGGTDAFLIGDFDGDGRADIGAYRNGTWLIRQSITNAVRSLEFGLPTDRAVPSIYLK